LRTSYSLKKAGSLGAYYRVEGDIGQETSDFQHISSKIAEVVLSKIFC